MKEKKGERDVFGLKQQQERDSFSSVFYYWIDLWFGSPNVYVIMFFLYSQTEFPLYMAEDA